MVVGDDDVGRVRDAIAGLLLLPLAGRVMGRRCRKVKEHLGRLGSGRRSCSVRFRRGIRSICLYDILLKSRRRS